MRKILVVTAAMLAAAPPAAAPACGCGVFAPRQAVAGATVLGGGTTVIPLRLRMGAASPVRPMVVIDGLGYDAPPGVLYKVLLRGRGGRSALVGVINLFDAEAGAGRRLEFDAGNALRQLGGEADALLFEPTSGVAGVAPRPNPASRMRFEQLTIERR